MGKTLKECQQRALDFVGTQAGSQRTQAREMIAHILEMCAINGETTDSLAAALSSEAQVCLHFHPDREAHQQRTVLESLAASGIYESQFVTGCSAGSVSAKPGGARYVWESELFGGAYDKAECSPHHRPKYGSLYLWRSCDGSSPRFGSCYLLLTRAVSARCTFTYMDSHLKRPERGTLTECDHLISALLAECFERDFALGKAGVSVAELVEALKRPPVLRANEPLRNLDHYIEAQIHGEVRLASDVEALVADSSYLGTEWEPRFESLCEQYGMQLRWHPGFRLKASEVPSNFRGAIMPHVADRVAGPGGVVDAYRLGLAARLPEFCDNHAGLQHLKRLWHVLVKFGRSA